MRKSYTQRPGLSRKGTVIVQDDTGITNLDGVFAAGDVVSGPLSVIEAMATWEKGCRSDTPSFSQ